MRKILGDAGALVARRAWYRSQTLALTAMRHDNGRRRLLVDVSLIAKTDARTGIQRVVRGVWFSLLEYAGEIELVPVVASRHRGYSALQYSDDGSFEGAAASAEPVDVRQGDIFLGLDLSAHLLPVHTRQIEHWKALGVTIAVVCYDLLPKTHPQFFTSRTRTQFNHWIEWVLRTADMIFGISDDVLAQIKAQTAGLQDANPPKLHKLFLGGDLLESAPSIGVRASDRALINLVKSRTAVLMVGTIEPRKGYSVALDAFEKLWANQVACHLVIVGKMGWKSRSLISRLRNHPQRGKQLHWVEGASDEVLDEMYQSCRGLLVTAHAEGYCLPVVEAARHGLPVLARDIAVLREHDYARLCFFEADDSLPSALQAFIAHDSLESGQSNVPTWGDCGSKLLRDLGFLAVAGENQPGGCDPATSALKEQTVAIDFSPTEKNPYLRAQNLSELLHWDDVDFIRCAYVTLLGRQPDYSGEQHFLSKIRKGHAKEEIMSLLRASREGQRHDPGIAGLDRALKRAALARRPFVGWTVRLIWPLLEGDSANDRRMRAILNALRRNREAAREVSDNLPIMVTAPTRSQAPADIQVQGPDAPELARLSIDEPLQSYFRKMSA